MYTAAARRWTLRLAPLALLIGSGALAANDAPTAVDPQGALSVAELNLPPQEMWDRATDYVKKMQKTVRRSVELQELARQRKDIIKLNCINDKLLQLKGHLAVGDQAMSNLNESIAKSDDTGRKHEYERISILHQKVQVLSTEAENCIGEDLTYVGGATVEVEIDSSIAQAEDQFDRSERPNEKKGGDKDDSSSVNMGRPPVTSPKL